MKGQIINFKSNKYLVHADKIYECVAKGEIKRKGNIYVGDYVEINNGVITAVYKRKNFLFRPSVANIDAVNIVVANPPIPDFYMLDNLITNCVYSGLEIIITVNKSDLDNSTINKIKENYSAVADLIIETSCITKDNIDVLRNALSGKLIAFAGQSAVGKTSLINALFNLQKKVGEISEKSGRGKHTTTDSNIIWDDKLKVIDTPGFSALNNAVSAEDLCNFYPEYVIHSHKCRFRGCTHICEPECEVKKLLSEGKLNSERYERYKNIFEKLKKEKRYE